MRLNMNSRFPAIAFVITIFLALTATIEAKETDNFLASLQKCSKALDSSEKALQPFNAGSLPLQYKESARLEIERTKWLENIRLARSIINSLKKRKNLKDTFSLFGILKGLDLEMDGVRVKLFDVAYDPAILKDKNTFNNNDWIKSVENADKELDEALVIFTDAAYSYMYKMDNKLERCQ
jgi:hypothetical protein